MSGLYFSTGQAARELGIGPAAIRSLCASGAVEAQSTPGGQYRIPKTVVETLKRDGLPPVLRPLPADHPRPTRHPYGHPALLDEPTEDAVAAADNVVVLENEVKSLGLRRQKEEQLDWFRDHEEREAERRAAQEREEREECRRTEAERERRLWLEQWTDHALGLIPRDAPRDVRLDVAEVVRRTLEPLEPGQPDTLTERLVDAAVARALAPWRRTKEIEKAIQEAADSLPSQARRYFGNLSEWQIRAKQAAAERIAQLRSDAPPEEMKAAAKQAGDQVGKEFEHQEACRKMVADTWMHLRGWTNAELGKAKDAVQQAVDPLPVGAAQRERERARDAALAPIQAAVDSRKDREMREGVIQAMSVRLPWGFPDDEKPAVLEAARKALAKFSEGTAQSELERATNKAIQPFLDAQAQGEKKERLIDAGLREIHPYLLKLEQDWEFDKSAWALDEELKPAIGEQLEDELSGNESEEQVKGRVRRLVREELDL